HGDELVVAEAMTLPVPEGLTPVEAAALPEGLATAWWNLVRLGRLGDGERVLVPAANSGMGHLIVQAALARGAEVIAGTRGDRWHARLSELGAVPVATDAADAGERLQRAAPGGVDVIVDLVGAANAPLYTSALRRDGRWLSVGILGGTDIELSLRDVIRQRWTVTGSSIRSLSAAEKRIAIAGVRADLWPAVALDRIRPHIHRIVPADRRDEAFAVMEDGGFFGKIVLERNI
ncbi:MAG: zinc-binding dehydrogenase, partial [Microbacterium sp.]